ncbi:MAG: O-antigen polysaccharide polymerase Wzy [Lachnospiraceae bacterium]|nr:O-antigen polysaccharide polymerase Wzy [Lachnospiraceae bacterium]
MTSARFKENIGFLALDIIAGGLVIWTYVIQKDDLEQAINLIRIAVYLSWFTNIFYALKDVVQRFAFMLFNVAFFILLLGRTAFFMFSDRLNYNWGFENIYMDSVYATFVMMYISLTAMLLGFMITKENKSQTFSLSKNVNKSNVANPEKLNEYRKIAIWIYYLAMPFAYAIIFEKYTYISTHSYVNYYLEYKTNMPVFIVALSNMCTIAFCAYLATYPEKTKCKLHIMSFAIMTGVSLLTGGRADFVKAFLLLLAYFFLREATGEEKWIDKKMVITMSIAVPLLVVGTVATATIRLGEAYSFESIGDSFLSFFLSNGVSAKVVAFSVELKETVTGVKFYSLYSITDLFRNNKLIQFIHPFQIYYSGTVEKALQSNSYASFVSFSKIYDAYFRGNGLGTSYLAELYMDFGYIGVALGSILIGFSLKSITRALVKEKRFVPSWIYIMMLRQLIYIPRDCFSSYIVAAFNVTSILTILIILLGTKVLYRHKK